jgi:uridylate kinase
LPDAKYKRILLKLSGEVLNETPLDKRFPTMAGFIVNEISTAVKDGFEIAIVIGGGNIFRGINRELSGVKDRVIADQMGMLATVINALTLKDAFENAGSDAEVLSAFEIGNMTKLFNKQKAIRSLSKGKVVILAGGTGNPFFSTDTAAALRSLEIEADALVKGSKVDGIYDKDPVKFPDAVKIQKLTYEEALERDVRVMDQTSFALLKDYKIPIIVYKMNEPGLLLKVLKGTGDCSVVRNK